MSDSTGRHVIICGAGPAGATLAVGLAERGVRVTLLERHHDLDREFRGEWLNRSGQAALAMFGLDDLLATIPTARPTGATVFVQRDGRFDEVLTMRADADGPAPDHLLVPQPALLRAIIARAESSGRCEFSAGTIVTDLVRDDGGRVVGVLARRGDDTVELRADLVIGCDGRTSRVRRSSGLRPSEERGGPVDMVWFKAPLPESVDQELGYQFLQRGGTAFSHPHPDGPDRHQYGWAFPKGTYGELRREGKGAWIEAMRRHVPPVFGDHLAEVAPDVDAAFLEIVSNHLTTWSVPGLLLLGDAAHPMSAVGGQGINLALRDAVVAANHLVPVLTATPTATADAIDGAAARVAPERLPEIAKIQSMQQRAVRMLTLDSAPARFAMEQLLPRLGRRAAPLLARGVGTTKAFNEGVTKVALTV